VIDAEGTQLGIMPIQKAMGLAKESGYDLVEVAPQAIPPVCRLLDYGKFLYNKEKRERQSRRHQKSVSVKEVTFRQGTDIHDYQTKVRNLSRFLEGGHRVKVVIRHRGREMSHLEIGQRLLGRVRDDVKELGAVEKEPETEGRQLVMVLVPKNSKPRGESKDHAKTENESSR
jgi:translation initiation factor IF-3